MTWIIKQKEMAEGDTGVTVMRFDVEWRNTDPVPHPDATDIVLNLKLHHGTTDANDVYMASPRVLIKPKADGTLSGTFDVYLKTDTDAESDETFQVEITTGAWIEPGIAPVLEKVGVFGKGTIINDDGPVPQGPVPQIVPYRLPDTGDGFGGKDDFVFVRDDLKDEGERDDDDTFFDLYARSPVDPSGKLGVKPADGTPVDPYAREADPIDAVVTTKPDLGDLSPIEGLL